MGFLDHSTNNIIVDAVLTKKGREYLAKNNGEFNIQTFSLGDDEVDYSIIKQYGRTVGKEKIEKNTPVLEATTESMSPIKYSLITVSEPIIFFPTITPTLGPDGFTSTEVLDLGVTGSSSVYSTSADVKFKISTSGNRITANSFSNNVYRIEMDSRLIRLTGGAAEFTDTFDKRTFYIVKATSNATGASSLNESNITFNLSVADNINTSTTEFAKYQVAGETFVRTYVRISSNQTGISKIFEVKIHAKTTA